MVMTDALWCCANSDVSFILMISYSACASVVLLHLQLTIYICMEGVA